MLLKIAWRNVWRSPGRTITIILAITVGVASLSFLTGFINGFIISFVDNGINSDYSHIQLHHPEYKKDKEVKYFIENGLGLSESINESSYVKAVSPRTIIGGMISSAKAANGITIYGISEQKEALTTHLDSALIEGTYFKTIKRNPVLISSKIAEKLKLKLKSKLVLTFQNTEGEIVAGAFRVDGIFDTKSVRINNSVVYVRSEDLSRLLGGETKIHEIAILLNDLNQVPVVYDSLTKAQPSLLVESWGELAPELELMQSQIWINMIFVLVIIMGALCFGIVNTMLMAVLERIKELGMLMAVGMKKTRVFSMIVMETLLMAAVGSPVGLIIGWLINHYFITNGLDLTAYSAGLKEYGYDAILYPEVSAIHYTIIAFGVALTAIIASVYPARKATKLKPVEALHTI